MSRSIRIDAGTLQKPRRTSQGYLRVDGWASRTGILEYRNPDGSIRRELREPDAVFNEDSLTGFEGAPVTDDHPSEMVSLSNAKSLTKGTVLSTGRRDGDHVAVSLVITDPDLIRKVESGKRQLSTGYYVEMDETPGVHPQFGRYDARQVRVGPVNHLAIVDRGRAGTASLRMDASDVRLDALVEVTMEDRLDSIERRIINLKARRDGEWDESLHPRDESGRFGEGGSYTGPHGKGTKEPGGKPTRTYTKRHGVYKVEQQHEGKGNRAFHLKFMSNDKGGYKFLGAFSSQKEAESNMAAHTKHVKAGGRADAWDESLHPRDESGRFGSGGGGSSKSQERNRDFDTHAPSVKPSSSKSPKEFTLLADDPLGGGGGPAAKPGKPSPAPPLQDNPSGDSRGARDLARTKYAEFKAAGHSHEEAIAKAHAAVREAAKSKDEAKTDPNPLGAQQKPEKPAKRPTYVAAQSTAFKALAEKGWAVKSNLKIPHATSPDGETRLWFKPQAVWKSEGKGNHSLKTASSTFDDLRDYGHSAEGIHAFADRHTKRK